MRIVVKYIFIFLIIFLFSASPLFAKHKHLEKYYQHQWNVKYGKGIESKYLSSGVEVDVLTSEYAVEIEFAQKWEESIGQSLFYADQTGKVPCVVLIMENPERDQSYLDHLLILAKKYNIAVWIYNGEWHHIAKEWHIIRSAK